MLLRVAAWNRPTMPWFRVVPVIIMGGIIFGFFTPTEAAAVAAVYAALIGLLTPPVGLNLYIISNIADISFWRAFKGTAPFIVPLLIVLIIITYVPETVLWLPRLILK